MLTWPASWIRCYDASPLEVADVVRQYGAAYLARYGHVTSTAQQRVLRALTLCRTAALGGHTTACDHCGHLGE
jgi:hypothetical protein